MKILFAILVILYFLIYNNNNNEHLTKNNIINVSSDGFVYFINKIRKPTLKLKRGQTYIFKLDKTVKNHPFIITTKNTNGGDFSYEHKIVKNSGADSGDITFTIPSNEKNTLYYNCGFHRGMGNKIIILN